MVVQNAVCNIKTAASSESRVTWGSERRRRWEREERLEGQRGGGGGVREEVE